jgi:hypothetical protein
MPAKDDRAVSVMRGACMAARRNLQDELTATRRSFDLTHRRTLRCGASQKGETESMIRNMALAAIALCAVSGAALASGTAEEQAACRPDVRKFCQSVGTDEFVVLTCLQQNREKLSKACRKVLESNGV